MRLSADWDTQQLTISWQGGAATTFDLMILRTELNETVFYVRAFVFGFVLVLLLLYTYITNWLNFDVNGAIALLIDFDAGIDILNIDVSDNDLLVDFHFLYTTQNTSDDCL